jgi:hypothetical protein
MGTKSTKKEVAVAPAAKTAPKRKVAVRPGLTRARQPAAKPAGAAISPAAESMEASAVFIDLAEMREPSAIPNEVIALRAYFLGEARQAAGETADPVADWLEAERQLLAESQA